jgi:DNA invertase Pin-like site-specific DNA recombinase
MLTVLGGLEFERELIRARTDEGWERARPCAVKLGPKPKLTRSSGEVIKRRDEAEDRPVATKSTRARFHA